MAKKKTEKIGEGTKGLLLGASGSQNLFSVSSYTLNQVVRGVDSHLSFPGNISPEGYFYSPFYEVTLKELDDELTYINTKRVNFVPASATVTSAETTFYDPSLRVETSGVLYYINITSPVPYNMIPGQPFCIYDVLDDKTYRGYIESLSGLDVTIATETEIYQDGLDGTMSGSGGNSRYILSLLEDNAPIYAEFIPTSQKLIWRGSKKMSELNSDSPIYDMPFTNGRNYVHQNVDVFVRRQDPDGENKLLRPSINNPLYRFQVEGDKKMVRDEVKYIIDSLINAC